jgi:SIR2-like domain
MPHILLTGAGFSRNWGGLLAYEAFDYLLGCSQVGVELRQFIWAIKNRGGGFEDALAQLQGAYDTQFSPQIEENLRNLTSGVYTMFGEMSLGFARRQFEPQNKSIAMMVGTFLSQFDAIFTLNQDTLLEQKYFGNVVGGKYADCYVPGIKRTGATLAMGSVAKIISLGAPDPSSFRLSPDKLPYIKLHGSCDWVYEERNLLLILGGNKAANIQKHSLLKWYHSLFFTYLSKPDTRLMVIGYSFNDEHINTAIRTAAEMHGLTLFIMDPLGISVLDKRDPRAQIIQPIGEYMEALSPHIIGASQRPLLSTFNDDFVEHDKIMRFFK